MHLFTLDQFSHIIFNIFFLIAFFALREQHSTSPSTRPFTSFSVKLSGIVHELHRCLLQALMAETSATTKAQILKVTSYYIQLHTEDPLFGMLLRHTVYDQDVNSTREYVRKI